jgi:hypothetical protein
VRTASTRFRSWRDRSRSRAKPSNLAPAPFASAGAPFPPALRPMVVLAASSRDRTMAAMADLLLRRAPAAPGEVYDVLRGRRIVGRIMLSNGSAASQWVWTMSYHYHEDRTPTHGYEPTRDAAMKAFAKSWHRE